MTTPYDPGRPEDRPSDQPGYPPPEQPPQGQPPSGGGYAGGPGSGQYPPAPDYGGGQQYGSPPQYGSAPPPPPQYGSPPPPQYGNAPPYGSPPAYGGAPAYGTPYGAPAAPVAPPNEVVRAVQLMFVRVALGVLNALIAFASADSIKDSIREGDPSLTQDQVDSAFAVALGATILFGLIFAVLYILLAIQVRKGKNWARIVTWVLAGLGVLGGILGLFGTGTGLEKTVDVIVLLVDVAIIVLLAMRPSNEYFAARRAPRY